MSSSITEYDAWPRVRTAIEDELAQRLYDLRTVTPDNLRVQQARIEALEWVLAEARPKPAIITDEEEE